MSIEHLVLGHLVARTAADTAPRPDNLLLVALAALLSFWPRREHPPDIPDRLRSDLGLPPDYRMMTWHDVAISGRTRRIDHE